MILSNRPEIHGREIEEELGVVSGSIVNSRFFLRDFVAGIRKFLGRELVEYTQLLDRGRKTATERMIAQASSLGANAVVNVRFQSSEITRDASEVFVYGTAVKVKE